VNIHSLLLPITDYRQEILASVVVNQITILTAETGAGKSTQVPQYLAEAGYEKIVITQPRILAARTLSERVREEWTAQHGLDQGYRIAYRTAYERDDTEDAIILYCTDGLQLVREVTGSGTGKNQVLILDEIHEWNQNMEVLVAWAKKRCQEDVHFKVVIMSATIDADRLANYFSAPPPILVPGRNHGITLGSGEDVVEEILNYLEGSPQNILVFLPGKAEIEHVANRIKSMAEFRNVPIIPLHSQLEAEEQQLAFESYAHGKVILATNIAQTSITIDDIDLVIDSGLERRTEIEHGVEGLCMGQASRADCLQRAGRAGRTKPGKYLLCPLDRMPCQPLQQRPAYGVPEILRTHLDRLVLRLASAEIDIEDLEFFHAPKLEAITEAKHTLRTLGAINEVGALTPLGLRMERYPVESRYARMLAEAEGFSPEVRIKLAAIIAIQEVGGIVRGGSRSIGWRQFTTQTQSDLLAHYEVYIELPNIDREDFEELGIIAKSVTKATETLQRLAYDLGHSAYELRPFLPTEELELRTCIAAGQIDQIWLIENDGSVRHVSGGKKRELSGGTVVQRTGLISGTPFNLEIPTPKGLETLYLVQDVTLVDPSWLVAAAPDLYSARAGKIYFDGPTGVLTRHWNMTYNRHAVKGVSAPVLGTTVKDQVMCIELYSGWLHERLEGDRRRLQKETGKRIAMIPIHTIHDRVRTILGPNTLITELNMEQRNMLDRLASMRTYMGDIFHSRHTSGRKGPRNNRRRRH
jgi:hypothetical protein